jgi:hypothetical protein
VSEKSLRNGEHLGFIVTAKALPGASDSLALERMQKKVAAEATGGILVRSREAKWKFRLSASSVVRPFHPRQSSTQNVGRYSHEACMEQMMTIWSLQRPCRVRPGSWT